MVARGAGKVFGWMGARPFNHNEQRKMYPRDGKLWVVSDDPKDALDEDR